jgi:Na+-driven multidrug efflux pump
MKPPVAVALVVMGTVLILAPIGADYLFQRNLVSILTKEPSAGVTLIGQLSGWYRVACWLTGTLMVLVGAFAAAADARADFYVENDDETDLEEQDEANKN